jgi:DNA invertase Pin-like site-specific DNA recombinase
VDRRVEIDYVFDRLGESHLVQAYRILVPERQKRTEGVHDDEHGRDLCASLLDFTEAGGNDCESDVGVERVRQVPGAGRARRLVFEDEGFSGSTVVQPALERLRDLVAQVHVDILLCHAPDRLARRYAYQVLLLEEFARAGTAVRFLKATPADTPEAALLVQVQGIIAEYEKAQILERTRRGKLHRAKAGSVNVLSGAPFGYRYVRKGTDTPAHYEIVEHEARIVRELFRHYTEEPLSLRALGKWLTEQGIPTAAGKTLWDHSTVRQLLRNPAYCGQAAFGRTAQMDQLPRTTRWHRLSGAKPGKRPARRMTLPEHWIHIVVPAIVSEELFELAARRLEDKPAFLRTTNKAAVSVARIDCVPTLQPCLLSRPEKVSRWRQLRLLSLRRQ